MARPVLDRLAALPALPREDGLTAEEGLPSAPGAAARSSSKTPLPARSLAADPAIVPPRDGLLPAIQSLLTVLVVGLFLTTFTVQPVRIPSSSMEPTLLVGDFLLLDKQTVLGDAGGLLPPATIRPDDVIVFHDPVDDPSVHLVKRVIGVPGDRIHLRNGVVFRNGVAVNEPFTLRRPTAPDLYRDDFPDLDTLDLRVDPAWWIALRRLAPGGELTVPANDYFVLGDNRNDSEDSRYWGFVPRPAIIGKPVLVYFSLRQPSDEDPVLLAAPSLSRFARWDRTFHVIH